MLKDDSSRRLHNNSNRTETRGRKKLIAAEYIQKMQEIIENGGIQARAKTWHELAAQVGLIGANHVHWHTV